MSDLWADGVGDPRTYGTPVEEFDVYVEYLRNYRLTLELKCSGLSAAQPAARAVPPSSLSLLGLLRHMAGVEHQWFRNVLSGEMTPRPYREDGNRDGDFDGAVADDAVVAEAWTRWRAEVANAEIVLAAQTDLGRVCVTERIPEGVSVRDVVVHMIEEYARHCGHADLLRECVDGRTGQ